MTARRDGHNPLNIMTTKTKSRIAEGRRKVAYIEDISTWDSLVEIADRTGQTPSTILRCLTRQFCSQHKNTSDLSFTFIPNLLEN